MGVSPVGPESQEALAEIESTVAATAEGSGVSMFQPSEPSPDIASTSSAVPVDPRTMVPAEGGPTDPGSTASDVPTPVDPLRAIVDEIREQTERIELHLERFQSFSSRREETAEPLVEPLPEQEKSPTSLKKRLLLGTNLSDSLSASSQLGAISTQLEAITKGVNSMEVKARKQENLIEQALQEVSEVTKILTKLQEKHKNTECKPSSCKNECPHDPCPSLDEIVEGVCNSIVGESY